MTDRPRRPSGHITTTLDTVERIAFEDGGTITIPPGGGWATLTTRRGSFCAWVPAAGSEVAA